MDVDDEFVDAVDYKKFPKGDDERGNPFDPIPDGDDDRKYEHTDLSWYKGEVSTSTRRGSAEDAYAKLSARESNKDEAMDRLLSKYPKADTSKVTAEIDDFDQTMVKLLSRKDAAKFPLFDDGTIGNSAKKTRPLKTLLEALGPRAEDKKMMKF